MALESYINMTFFTLFIDGLALALQKWEIGHSLEEAFEEPKHFRASCNRKTWKTKNKNGN